MKSTRRRQSAPPGAFSRKARQDRKEKAEDIFTQGFRRSRGAGHRPLTAADAITSFYRTDLVEGFNGLCSFLTINRSGIPREPEPRAGTDSGTGSDAQEARLSRRSYARSGRNIPRPHRFRPRPPFSGSPFRLLNRCAAPAPVSAPAPAPVFGPARLSRDMNTFPRNARQDRQTGGPLTAGSQGLNSGKSVLRVCMILR